MTESFTLTDTYMHSQYVVTMYTLHVDVFHKFLKVSEMNGDTQQSQPKWVIWLTRCLSFTLQTHLQLRMIINR